MVQTEKNAKNAQVVSIDGYEEDPFNDESRLSQTNLSLLPLKPVVGNSSATFRYSFAQITQFKYGSKFETIIFLAVSLTTVVGRCLVKYSLGW